LKTVDITKVVVIDETGCNIKLTPEYGWAIRGERLVDRRPACRGKNLSVVGAVRVDRVLCHDKFEGALNGERWLRFVEKTLCAHLYPGDIVLLDNLAIHKNTEAVALIEATGATVKFLPPYSPDLSPIEMCWSFVKHHLRRLRERDIPALRRGVWRVLMRVTGRHLAAWFEKCGFPVHLK
jgi:transposase